MIPEKRDYLLALCLIVSMSLTSTRGQSVGFVKEETITIAGEGIFG